MSSVNQGATLIALATFLDLYNKRSHLTLLFSGTQGIGKSESLYLAAEKVNGFAATIDGSVLNDGEHLEKNQGKHQLMLIAILTKLI